MRLLFSSTRGLGHALPLMPFIHAARRAGHEVLLAGPPPIAAVAAREQLAYAPLPAADPERLAAARSAAMAGEGVAAMAIAARDMFTRCHAHAALPGMLAVADAWQPDVLVHESAELSALVAGAALGVPTARVGVALGTPYEDLWLRLAAEALDELHAELGAAPDPGAARAAATPLLTQVPAAVDAGQHGVPAVVHRFRDDRVATVRRRDAAASRPAEDDGPPLVPISFGTMLPQEDALYPAVYRAAIDAIADLPIRVLVTTGRDADPARLGALPANVRAERWIPIGELLAHATAFVTHGGAGTVLAALSAGVPMAVLPMAADQPFNAQTVARLGAGVALDGGPGAAPRLGDAVRALLDDPRHAAAAAGVAADAAALPPVEHAVDVLEALASRPAPQRAAVLSGGERAALA